MYFDDKIPIKNKHWLKPKYNINKKKKEKKKIKQWKKNKLNLKSLKISFRNEKKIVSKFIIKILLIILLSTLYLFFMINYILSKKPNRKEFIFIVCMFGKKKIASDNRLRKYFYVINRFLPNSKIVLAVSEYTFVEPKLFEFENITVNIERFGNFTRDDVQKRFNYGGSTHFYFSGLRPTFYAYYLKAHPEIKYVAISDDDTLFIKDPFSLIEENPNIVHIMEDIFPFSRIIDGNYKWTNAYVNLDNLTKIKCGFKFLNKSLLSPEIKDLIPLNSGMMIGNSKNIIKITELISTRFRCAGMFPNNAEQGLLNYLALSGELKELGFPIHTHNVFNSSLLSCPDLLPIENYTQQINSNNTIAVHHYQFIKSNYIKKSPFLFQKIINMKI
jgi:hypothetical protein